MDCTASRHAHTASNAVLLEKGVAAGAVELRNALAMRFALELPATAVFDFPTIAALTRYMTGAVASRQRAVAPTPDTLLRSGLGGRGVAAEPGLVEVVGMSCIYPGDEEHVA